MEEASRLAKDFRILWKNYVLQSLLATISIFIVLLFLSLQHAVVIASIGATTFIIFTMPNSIAAKSKNV
ncbi:MAG: HPP family protein, partial [Thermoprotei archaeon]